jgi:hypothetical protein
VVAEARSFMPSLRLLQRALVVADHVDLVLAHVLVGARALVVKSLAYSLARFETTS